MTDSAKTQALAAQSLLSQRSLSRTQSREDSANPVRFMDVLAGSKSAVFRREGGGASPEQMFEPSASDPRTRRRTELRRDYRESLEQRSSARAEERTSVRARRTSAPQYESTIEPPAQAGVPLGKDDKQGAVGMEFAIGNSEQSPERSSGTPESANREVLHLGSATPQQRIERSMETSGREHPMPPVTLMPAQTKPVGTAPMPVAAEPQAARELGRLLASPIAMNSEREISPLQGMVSGRLDQTPRSEAKVARDADAPKGSFQPSATQTKPPESSTATEFERLIRLVRAQSGRQSSTRVLLDPPELGKVHIRVTVDGDRVEVGVETEKDSARELITERAEKLKTVLEDRGFIIERFDVTTNQTGLFSQSFVSGQDTPLSRQDRDGSGMGRALSGRTRGSLGKIPAAGALEVSPAGLHDDVGLDIRV